MPYLSYYFYLSYFYRVLLLLLRLFGGLKAHLFRPNLGPIITHFAGLEPRPILFVWVGPIHTRSPAGLTPNFMPNFWPKKGSHRPTKMAAQQSPISHTKLGCFISFTWGHPSYSALQGSCPACMQVGFPFQVPSLFSRSCFSTSSTQAPVQLLVTSNPDANYVQQLPWHVLARR